MVRLASRLTFFRALAAAVSVAALSACSTTGPAPASAPDDGTAEALERALQAPPAPALTEPMLLPEADPALAPLPEERFDVAVDDAPIPAFLMSLVADSEWNLVVHPDVGGRVTLELSGVTVPEVLDVMREIHDLEYTQTQAGFVVRPARLENRIYEVDYLNLMRSGFSKASVSSGQSTDLPPALLGGGPGYQGGLGAGAGGENGDQEDDSVSTRIRTESESSFWDELAEAVEQIIGAGDDRRVITNAQAGILAVVAMPSEHRAVESFLDAVEDSVRRQVILEARIIEVELRDEFRSGINWQALAEIDGVDVGFGPVSGRNLFQDEVAATAGRTFDLTPGSALPSLDTTAFGGPFALSASSADFNAFIELLELQGDTRVLSSPRIATVNNQKAVIKVGSDEFFVTGVQSQTAAGTATSTTASSVQLTPFFSGIALDVTPQISRDGDVVLHVHPTISDVRDQIKEFTTGGQEEELPLAFSTVRESDSIIRARSGQLVVIGGLMRDEAGNQRLGTPGLSRLPLLGHLFGSRRNVIRKTELVILLRPVVVDGDEAWASERNARLERLREIGAAASRTPD
jgi:MSHA biogenesis protein MshL